MAAVAKRMMVGFDGSESACRALDRAADLAGYGSSVTVVTVSAPNGNGEGARLLREAGEQLAARLVPAYVLNLTVLPSPSRGPRNPVPLRHRQVPLRLDERAAA
jgi:nucleotide-binding universal stress UspA family protein